MNVINLKLFFRKLVKDRIYVLINTIGLSVGIASVFLLYFWIMYEFNYDKYNKNFENIHLVSYDFEFSRGVINHVMETPGPLAKHLKENYPEIKEATTCQKFFKDKYLINNEKKFLEKGYAVSSSFFDIFSIDFVYGDKESSFESSNSIAISESLAKKLFNKNPIGEKVRVDDEGDFFVSAVFKDLPCNSSIKFDYLLTMSYINNLYNDLEVWQALGYSTFVLLDENTNANELSNKLKDILVTIDFGEISKRVILTPLKDFHFHSNFGLFVENTGDIRNTYILIFLALFILLISVVNYVNLSIARSDNRRKEIGVKKTFGVSKYQLIKQFYFESLIVTSIVSIVSLMLVLLFIPKLQIITGKSIINGYMSYKHLLGLVGIITFIGILSGLYPSLYLASLKPVTSVQNHFSRWSIFLKKGLVFFQFVVVMFVTICVVSIHTQVNFMMNKDLGYDRENLIRINMGADTNKSNEIKNELLQYPEIENVTQSSQFLNLTFETGGWDWKGNTQDNLSVFNLGVGSDFSETLKIDILKGNHFSKNPEARISEVIINETACKFMEVEDCIGMKIKLQDNEYKIIGVVNDFHYKHLKYKIKPLLITYNNDRDFIVRVKQKNRNTLEYIEKIYNKFNTSFDPFSYSYISDDIVSLYGDEKQLKNSISGFLIVLLFISIIGMIGMMTSHISNINKELAIRKVFGANDSRIIQFLLNYIIKIVLLAYIIALPIAILVINKWLGGFANKAEINPITYVIVGLLFILFSLAVLFNQIYRASKISSIEVLRISN